jgi:hypothetical protein
MVKRHLLFVTAVWGILAGGRATAADVYVVRFNTARAPAFAEAPCTYLTYRDELIFYNSTPTEAAINLVGVSNGPAPSPRALAIEAGSVRSSEGDSAAAASWAPDPQPLLWVARLDVPNGVEVVSRLLVPAGAITGCGGSPGGLTRTYAGIRMPVVHQLTAPGVPQVHLGTDIGGDAAGTADDGRTNVGVYNASSAAATAAVELRRGCDGAVVASRLTTIPPNTIVQINGLPAAFQGCSATRTASYESYVVVTVDQPSFSYAITLSNQRPPWIPVSSSP